MKDIKQFAHAARFDGAHNARGAWEFACIHELQDPSPKILVEIFAREKMVSRYISTCRLHCKNAEKRDARSCVENSPKCNAVRKKNVYSMWGATVQSVLQFHHTLTHCLESVHVKVIRLEFEHWSLHLDAGLWRLVFSKIRQSNSESTFIVPPVCDFFSEPKSGVRTWSLALKDSTEG